MFGLGGISGGLKSLSSGLGSLFGGPSAGSGVIGGAIANALGRLTEVRKFPVLESVAGPSRRKGRGKAPFDFFGTLFAGKSTSGLTALLENDLS